MIKAVNENSRVSKLTIAMSQESPVNCRPMHIRRDSIDITRIPLVGSTRPRRFSEVARLGLESAGCSATLERFPPSNESVSLISDMHLPSNGLGVSTILEPLPSVANGIFGRANVVAQFSFGARTGKDVPLMPQSHRC